MTPADLRALMATAERQPGETTEQFNARHDAEHTLSSWRVWLPGLLDEIAAYRAQAINRGWNWRMCDAYGREEYERQMASEIDRTHEITMGRMTLAESYRDPSPITPASQARGGAPAVIRNPPAGAHSSSEVSQ